MKAGLPDQVLRLSGEERLEFVEKVWSSLPNREVPITDYERSVLDERLADCEKNPKAENSSDEVRARLVARRP